MDAQMIPVRSGMCTHVGYDKELQEFYMQHENGKVSIFSEVPETVAHGVMGAESIGRAYHAMIKGQFRHRYRE